MPSSSSSSRSSSWPLRPTKEDLAVLLLARALADEHQVGDRIAHAEHDLGPALAQRSACIDASVARAERRGLGEVSDGPSRRVR